MKESTATQALSRRAFLAKLAVLSPAACLALCAQKAHANPELAIQVGNPSNLHGPRNSTRTVYLCIKQNGQVTVSDAVLNPCKVHCFTNCANHPDHFDGIFFLSPLRAHCERCNTTHDMRSFVYTINGDASYDNIDMHVVMPTYNSGTGTSRPLHVPIGY